MQVKTSRTNDLEPIHVEERFFQITSNVLLLFDMNSANFGDVDQRLDFWYSWKHIFIRSKERKMPKEPSNKDLLIES